MMAQNFEKLGVDERVGGEDAAGSEHSIAPFHFGHMAAGFAHDHHAGTKIPGLQPPLPEAVIATRGDPGEIERGGTGEIGRAHV